MSWKCDDEEVVLERNESSLSVEEEEDENEERGLCSSIVSSIGMQLAVEFELSR